MADQDPITTYLSTAPLSKAQKADLWDAFHNAPDADTLAVSLKPLGVPMPVKARLWDLKSSAAPETSGATPAQVMVNGQPMSVEDYNTTQQTPERGWMDTAKDVGAGFAKKAAKTVQFVADDVPQFFGGAGLSDYADLALGRPEGDSYQRVSEGARLTSTPQQIGGALETAVELAVPIKAAAGAIPTTAKAGRKFQEVMGAARNVPVDVNGPGQVALRINELAERGGSMPMAVRKFLNRVTDPNKPGMVYEEARDFASNISRLSANEFQRLTPVVAKEVATLRVALNKAVAEAASKAGKGEEYAQAMNEYARAMKLKNAVDAAVDGAKRGIPYATAAGVGYWLTTKVRQALGGE
jgi:hypothetical protein